ncbi:MAG: peptide chain release factor-like protein [Myxococcales bacterium]|nr:peptide chain release factor-like protein [Myxococcales bacterium]
MDVTFEQARRAAALTDEALLAECEERFFVAGGPGGQHRNKTETAVRLTHRPTGLVVTATERRSQLMNRGEALERLRRLLVRLAHVPEKRIATRPSRGAKRRRLEAKRHLSAKKQSRRGEW